MHTEVKAAVTFLVKLMSASGRVGRSCLNDFKDSLEHRLQRFYQGHWFPDLPHKGSGYRCIRINTQMDPILASAARDSGITNLSKLIPQEFTLWVDPFDVSYRFGEDGSIGQIYSPLSSISEEREEEVEPMINPYAQPAQSSPSRSLLSSCKDQMSSSRPGSSVFMPFAAFVSS